MHPKAARIGFFTVFLATAMATTAQSYPKGLNVKIQYEDPIRNQHYPELLYWFVTPETLSPQRYTKDIEHISRDTAFDFPFLTARNGVNFFDDPATHDAVAGIVSEGHKNGLRIGATFELQDVDSFRKFSFDDEQTAVSAAEGLLDANGRGVVEPTVKLRSRSPIKTELLRVFIFRKTGDGEYDPATFADVTAQAKATAPQPGAISVALDLGPQYAGYTAFVMATT